MKISFFNINNVGSACSEVVANMNGTKVRVLFDSRTTDIS